MSGVVVLPAISRGHSRADPLGDLRGALTGAPDERLVSAFVACVGCADQRWLSDRGVSLRERAIAVVASGLREIGSGRSRAVAEVVVRLAASYALAPPFEGNAGDYARRVLVPVVADM